MSRAKGLGAGLLVLTALIWGTAFVAQSMGMDHVGPCAFNAARNFIGCAALLPVIFVSGRRRTGALEKSGAKAPSAASFAWRNPVLLTGGVLCGLFLGVASLLQQAGLQSTGAGKAGFLTSLYIVLVPVLGIFLGRRAGGKVWLAVALALAGAYFLSVAGNEGAWGMGLGDALVLASAVFFSFHILVIDRFSPRVDCVKLSCIQFFVAGLLSAVLAIALESGSFYWQDLLASWGPLLYTGVLSSGVAYTLQIVGQKRVEPTVASLIMSLESVFAAVSGWLVLGQPLSGLELLGCGLVFAGVVLAQIGGQREPKSELGPKEGQ